MTHEVGKAVYAYPLTIHTYQRKCSYYKVDQAMYLSKPLPIIDEAYWHVLDQSLRRYMHAYTRHLMTVFLSPAGNQWSVTYESAKQNVVGDKFENCGYRIIFDGQ